MRARHTLGFFAAACCIALGACSGGSGSGGNGGNASSGGSSAGSGGNGGHAGDDGGGGLGGNGGMAGSGASGGGGAGAGGSAGSGGGTNVTDCPDNYTGPGGLCSGRNPGAGGGAGTGGAAGAAGVGGGLAGSGGAAGAGGASGASGSGGAAGSGGGPGVPDAKIIITEIVDGTLVPGEGLPKFVELTNIGSTTADLSKYSIGTYPIVDDQNPMELGGGAATVLNGLLLAGDSYVISFEYYDNPPNEGAFEFVYECEADNLDPGAFFNGNDAIALFWGAATGDGSDAFLVDVYGVPGVNGLDTNWEYSDSTARRIGTPDPSPVFNVAQWDVPGYNFLESFANDECWELERIRTQTTPGTHP